MMIIKVGGGKQINWDYICQDIASLKEEVILVHGANWQMEEISKKLGQKTKMITSPSGYTSRYTDKQTLRVLTMVYSGLVNKQIVAKLQALGVNAVGLSGVDGRVWEGEWKKVVLSREGSRVKAIRDNFQGKVIKVNDKLLKLLLENNYLPVLTIPAISFENQLINVDNDRAIGLMAKALGVKKLVVLFEAPGLLKDTGDQRSVIKSIQANKIEDYLKYAQGRMKKKILGAKEAFQAGVKIIYWADGRVNNPIKKALKGEGTVIK